MIYLTELRRLPVVDSAGEPAGHVADVALIPAQDPRRVAQFVLRYRRRRLTVTSQRPARTVVEIVKWLDETGNELADIRIQRPSLEDAFIELTGKSLRE